MPVGRWRPSRNLWTMRSTQRFRQRAKLVASTSELSMPAGPWHPVPMCFWDTTRQRRLASRRCAAQQRHVTLLCISECSAWLHVVYGPIIRLCGVYLVLTVGARAIERDNRHELVNMGAVGRVHFCSARKKNPAQLESFRYLDPGATLLVRARPKTPISVSGVCNADFAWYLRWRSNECSVSLREVSCLLKFYL